MPECVFCRIVAGTIPSAKVYENARVLAFLDINPVAVGHVLVIPKTHTTSISQMADEDVSAVALALKELAPAVAAAVDAEGFNVLNNCGAVAGQAVDHVHFHIIPRKSSDGRGYRWITLSYEDGQMKKVAAEIVKRLK